jgi:uncharacterized protein DUF3619
MNEQEFAYKVAEQLQRSASDLDQAILSRLQAARTAALRRYRTREALLQANASYFSSLFSQLFSQRRRLWMGVGLAAILTIMIGLGYWEHRDQPEPDAIDAQLLAGDLPLQAYTERDFQTWVKEAR